MLLDVRNTDKKFNGVYALKDLNFSLDAGEIHGLVGENGAGKSTFIKILGGVYKRDGGSILWDGKELPEEIRPEESRNLGINIIFQDNVLIPAFTGAENICLGRPYPVKGGLIRWKEMEREAEEKAAELGIRLDLKKPVSAMTPAQKKCVEIVRAMMSDCKLLILDEPTASLSDKETKLLFSIVRNLKAKGTSVLYVTHRLEEIMELTDRVTVLRNGMLVSTVKTEETSRKELVRLMSGNEAADGVDGSEEHGITEREDSAEKNAGQSVRAGEAYRGEGRNADGCDAQDIGKTEKQVGNGTVTAPGKTALEVHGIRSGDGIVRGVDLEVKTGRITGMFGLCGSGRTEFLECIYGTRKLAGGTIAVNGKTTAHPTPSGSIRQGMAFICEDRRGKAMIPSFSIKENMMLSSIDRYTKNGWFRKQDAGIKAAEMIGALKIKCTGAGQPAKELSGVNQQKVVFAKALLTEPSIWICDEPTQAVDVATRQEIHRLLRKEAEKGKAVLYVSSDLTELLEIADEVAVMAYGKVRKTFENKDLKPADVLACCYEAEREENDR